jgi:hypothetical protein
MSDCIRIGLDINNKNLFTDLELPIRPCLDLISIGFET